LKSKTDVVGANPRPGVTVGEDEVLARPLRVLVVDDEQSIVGFVRLVLEDEGFQVATASNGVEGLAALQVDMPDVILLDLTMPVMDGWEFVRVVKERGIETPVILMTAGYRANLEAQRNGAAGFLGKPFDIDDLLQVIRQYAWPAR
jgi:CheY-like chemotaxis protein